VAAAAAAPAAGATPAPAAIAPTDGVLGRYRLVERIAEGTVAEVFTAVPEGASGVRRSVVIKRLRPELAENPANGPHFTAEATLLAKIGHRNIVPVLDMGHVNGTYYLAEEYVVGRDLERLTRRMAEAGRPPLSVPAVLYVIHEMLAALTHIHAPAPDKGAPLGFVHRSLSPFKVMVSRLGEIKLLDFRILPAGQASPNDLGAVKVNSDFASPEQARGRILDHRSDLFSVGLVIYFLAARESLYRGETAYDRLSRAAQGLGKAEMSRVAALPTPLPDLLMRALQASPDRRYESAAEFQAEVAPYLPGGEDEVAELVAELFTEDLQREIDRLASATGGSRLVG
jgi:serine/threonine-protein kinase